MNIIAVTAGHRGAGTGAVGYIDEGAETIVLRDLILKKLTEKGALIVYDNIRDSLSKVVDQMKMQLGKHDMILDIHFNSFNETAHGTEMVVPDHYNAVEWQTAEKILDTTCAILGTKNRGVKKESQTPHRRLAMLRDIECNNMLIEVCFASNKEDSEKYETHKIELAEAIAQILYDYARTDSY